MYLHIYIFTISLSLFLSCLMSSKPLISYTPVPPPRSKDIRANNEQGAIIARLLKENSQLQHENTHLLLQQGRSDASRLFGRSTVSLPPPIRPVISPSPIVDVSDGDLG